MVVSQHGESYLILGIDFNFARGKSYGDEWQCLYNKMDLHNTNELYILKWLR